jgi:hypothetical protein
MQHEPAIHLAFDCFDLLLIVRRAERHRDQRLGLAARKHGRAVDAGQHAHLRPDWPNLVELAAVETYTLLEHFVSENFLLQLLEDGLRLDLALDLAFGNIRDEIFEHLVDRAVALELLPHAHRFAERHENFLFHFAVKRVVDVFLRYFALRLASLFRERVDRVDDALDRGVPGVEALHHLFFGHFLRARLDHHDGIFAACHHEVEQALAALLVRRVDDVLAVDHPYAYTRDRLLERNARQREGRGSAADSEHVRVVVRIG